jgi:hypothetical protein
MSLTSQTPSSDAHLQLFSVIDKQATALHNDLTRAAECITRYASCDGSETASEMQHCAAVLKNLTGSLRGVLRDVPEFLPEVFMSGGEGP